MTSPCAPLGFRGCEPLRRPAGRLTRDRWRSATPAQLGIYHGLQAEQLAKLGALPLFKPTPPGWDLLSSTAKRILLRAANRIGKTRHAAAFLADRALRTPGGKFRAIGVSFASTNKIVGGALADVLPPRMISPGCSYLDVRGWKDNLIALVNGATIEIRSSDQHPDAHAGAALDGVWIDEPPPWRILDENTSRLSDYEGWLLLTMTPVNRPVQYIKKTVEAGVASGVWQELVFSFNRENAPQFSDEQIAARILECEANPATYDQRINGAWAGVTVDRFFTGYDPTRHREKLDARARLVSRWLIGIDHGTGAARQIAYLIGVQTVKGSPRVARAHVFRELANTGNMTADQIAAGIVGMANGVALAGGLDPRALWANTTIYGDTNAEGLGHVGKFNDRIAEGLKARGFAAPIRPPDKRPGTVSDGETLINALALAGGLSIDPGCALLDDALSHYRQTEALKDPVDALRYGLYAALCADLPPRQIQRG